MNKQYLLLLFGIILFLTIFNYEEYLYLDNEIDNLAYAHIFRGTPNSIFIEDNDYQIGFLPYPKNPKVNDDTLLNFNVQKDGEDVTNTFVSLIIMDKTTKKIIHQIPYKFYLFADMSYPYVFKNEGKYSLSLLTKISGDEKYENNPLIVTFDVDTENSNKISSNVNSIIFVVTAFTILLVIIFIYRKRIQLIINSKSKP